MHFTLQYRYVNKESGIDLHDLVIRKRQEILTIAKRRGAKNIRLFGSVSRHEARPDSDIDLLIDLGTGAKPSGCWWTCHGSATAAES